MSYYTSNAGKTFLSHFIKRIYLSSKKGLSSLVVVQVLPEYKSRAAVMHDPAVIGFQNLPTYDVYSTRSRLKLSHENMVS